MDFRILLSISIEVSPKNPKIKANANFNPSDAPIKVKAIIFAVSAGVVEVTTV